MSIQNRLDITNKSIILDASLALSKSDLVLAQDAGRVVPLVHGTLLAKIAATGKLVPYTNEAATDGSALPHAVFLGSDVPAADLVAGDVEGVNALLGGGAIVDINRLVIENGKLLSTIIAAVTVNAKTVEDALNDKGIFMGDSEDSTSFEN